MRKEPSAVRQVWSRAPMVSANSFRTFPAPAESLNQRIVQRKRRSCEARHGAVAAESGWIPQNHRVGDSADDVPKEILHHTDGTDLAIHFYRLQTADTVQPAIDSVGVRAIDFQIWNSAMDFSDDFQEFRLRVIRRIDCAHGVGWTGQRHVGDYERSGHPDFAAKTVINRNPILAAANRIPLADMERPIEGVPNKRLRAIGLTVRSNPHPLSHVAIAIERVGDGVQAAGGCEDVGG